MVLGASIVIPARNSADTLHLTIESALAQEWPGPCEVIVVDNGSTDGSHELVRRYPKVRYIEEARPGRSYARNCGREHALGEIIGLADADCELPSTWLRDSARVLDNACVGAVQVGIRKHGQKPPRRDFVHAHWYLPFVDTCALVTTATAFDAAGGFDTELSRVVDMDFSFRLLARGYALALLPDIVAVKHHYLDTRQVVRRGWDGGWSLALVGHKWKDLVPSRGTQFREHDEGLGSRIATSSPCAATGI